MPCRVKPENQAPPKAPIKFTRYMSHKPKQPAKTLSAAGRFVIKIHIGSEESGKSFETKKLTSIKKAPMLPRIALKPNKPGA